MNMIDRNLRYESFSSITKEDFTMKKESCQENSFDRGYSDHLAGKFICPYRDSDPRSSEWYDGWWNALMQDKGLTEQEYHKYMKETS